MNYRLTQIVFGIIFLSASLACGQEKESAIEKVSVHRLEGNPIIRPEMLSGSDGKNINGPSLIKVPDWIESPLGKYYLYFAHHKGAYIRLAYADHIQGPWKIYEKGTLRMEDCICNVSSPKFSGHRHIASPDILIDSVRKELVMYFHCHVETPTDNGRIAFPQVSLRATSKNGIDFVAEETVLGLSYFRTFKWHNRYYAMAKPGIFYRSSDGISNFEKGPNPFLKIQQPSTLRHSAVMVKGDMLYVFYSRVGDAPEQILLSTIPLSEDWNTWTPSEPVTILEPEFDYEGVQQPIRKSVAGTSWHSVRELRDPAIFEDDGKLYLLYSVAGELGIAIAEIDLGDD